MTNIQNTSSILPAVTPLHSLHHELGAKFVTFAGYEMPIQYPTGIIAEHNHTRNSAGLFDISHMGQLRVTGYAALELEKLVPADIVGLATCKQCYTLFTTHNGGVLDDLMVMNLGKCYMLIVNAACKHTDLNHLRESLSNQCETVSLEDQALLALQGPNSRRVLAKTFSGVEDLPFMHALQTQFEGSPCLITCSGYTGEDGFEISIAAGSAEDLTRLLLDSDEVLPIGLGARDSLRLEAGLCLYGHELSPEITPVEAGLSWVIDKARRKHGVRANGYLGAEKISEQLAKGVEKLRVGLLPETKAPIREGTELIDDKEQSVGIVTSGSYSPTLQRPIAMGYVQQNYAVPDLRIYAEVRNKRVSITTTQLPFVSPRYKRT